MFLPTFLQPILLSPVACFCEGTWYVPKETRGEHANSTQKGPLANPTFLGVGTDNAECGTRRQRPQLPQAGIEPRTF